MADLDKAIVYVSHISSVQNFSVITEDNLAKLPRLTKKLENLGNDPKVVKSENLKIGDVVLAKSKSKDFGGQFFRTKVLSLHTSVKSAAVSYIDTGKMEMIPYSSLFQLEELFSVEAMPALAVTNCQLDCFGPNEISKDVFLAITTSRNLVLQVLKTHEDGSLVVDLLIVDDDKAAVSVRDILVFTAKAEFDVNRFGAIPNINHHNFTQLPLLTKGDTREAFVSHIPTIEVDSDIMFYVQIVSRLSLKLPKLSKNMAKKYSTGDPLIHDLVGSGSFSQGMVCAVGDDEGGWYRAIITNTNASRMVTVRYVDFGNEEVVNSHKLKRLHGKFRRMPCLAVPVFLPIQVTTESDAMMLQQELEANIRFTEMKLNVLDVSREGKMSVSLEFLFGSNLENFIAELLK